MLFLGALSHETDQSRATSRAAQIFQENLLDALVRSGVRPTVRSYEPLPSFPRCRRLIGRTRRWRTKSGLEAKSLGHVNLGPLKIATLAVTAGWAVFTWSLRNRGARRVVLTYNLNAPPAYLVAPLCRWLGVKFVPFVGDLYVPGEVVRDTWMKRLEFDLQRRLLPRADGLAVCNRAIVDDLAPASHHVVLEGGVPERLFDVSPSRDHEGFHIVFAGQLSPLNGVDLLLDAMKLIECQELRVTVAGDGALRELVQEAAARDPRLEYLGLVPHERVPELYALADLSVNLRRTDGATHRYVFPSKVVECLASGVPLLTTRTGHVESEYGEFVFLLDDETAEGLAARICEIMAMRADDRASLALSARAHVRRHKTWDAQAAALVAYLGSHVFSVAPHKQRVMALVDYYLPGFKGGGPAVSVSRLAMATREDVETFVFTRDRDLGDAQPYACAQRDVWHRRPEAHVWYARPKALGPLSVLRAVRACKPDVLFLNSFFSKLTRSALVLRRLGLLRGVGTVVAPRGELSSGALGLKSKKKRAYLSLARALRLYEGALWKPSTRLERMEIESLFGEVECFVLPELSAPPSEHRRTQKQAGECKFVFVSRVSRKKNVEFALRQLASVAGRVEFDIHGPIEDEAYRRELTALIGALPPNVTARLCGPIAPQDVPAALSAAHFFLFPTLGENFGHAIAESLAVGTPCVLSDRTPWSSIQLDGAGWALGLEDGTTWAETLRACIEMGPEAHAAMVGAVRAHYSRQAGQDPHEGSRLFDRAA